MIAEDVQMQYAAGQLRFCERANLRGYVCARRESAFGKKHYVAQDWWSPETYVAAATGNSNAEIVSVQPQGGNLVIYFR